MRFISAGASWLVLMAALGISQQAPSPAGEEGRLPDYQSVSPPQLPAQGAAEQPEYESGRAYFRKGDYLNAARRLEVALRESPDDRDALQLLGLAYYHLGRPAEAIAPLQRLQRQLGSLPRDSGFVLALCYALTRQYDRARSAFAALYGLPAESAGAHLILSRMLVRQGFDPVAEEHASRGLSLNPTLPMAHFVLGEVYLYKSRVPQAAAEFQKELALDPANAEAWYRLGDVKARQSAYAEADAALRRAIWLDATQARYYALLGKIVLRSGDGAQARRLLERAVAMDPNDYTAHRLLGEAYRDLGDAALAAREFRISADLQRMQSGRR